MPEKIVSFKATGILGAASYLINFKSQVSVIVGPNGTGKSTFISLFYLFLSRQWARLAEYDFESLTLTHGGGEITVSKLNVLRMESTPSRAGQSSKYLSKIIEHNLLDVIYKTNLTRSDRVAISSALSVPESQVRPFIKYISDQIGLNSILLSAEREISALQLGPILYLPTYRRIEKDIKSIFPDIESSIRARISDSSAAGRSGAGFKEIAGFGMVDINKLIEDAVKRVKEFQRKTSERTSQEYIRDIVRGKISSYTISDLRAFEDGDFSNFRQRLDDDLFRETDKELLMQKITEIRQKTRGQPSAEQRYLGMFVERLLAGHKQVAERERPLRSFADIVSQYLAPSKRVSLTDQGISIFGDDGTTPLSLEKLSSGEKQVVAVFAYLLLSDQRDFIFIIDEPELSLSVPWQKRFIPDLINTGHCSQLIAVTHSPFVFDNQFRTNVIDVRKLEI